MPKSTDSNSGSFLGGGPKFNQAGDNKPMPGEKVSDAVVSPLPFGGPKVWLGVVVVIALLAILWIMFGNGIMGTGPKGTHSAISKQAPSDNPDAAPQ